MRSFAGGRIRHWALSRAVALLAILAAGWPVLRWYAARIGDGSDEPYGLAVLAIALLFAPWRAWREPFAPRARGWLCALLAVYGVTFDVLPPLVRALLVATMIGVAAAPRGFAVAWWGLVVLSLPVVATLQFYAGYPLRWITAHLCAPLLALGGHTVRAEGTTLHWRGERVIVDAPCSGLHMLWTGLVLAGVLACWHRLDTRRTFALLRVTSLIVFVANVGRATALFYQETGLWSVAEWAHEVTGLVAFACAAAVVLWRAERMAAADSKENGPPGPFGATSASNENFSDGHGHTLDLSETDREVRSPL